MTAEEIELQIRTMGPTIKRHYGYDYWAGWVRAMHWMIEKLGEDE